MSETGQEQQREVYYRGDVQGVGFRYTARRIAARFAVTGYVRNLPDGRVQLVAEGGDQEIERFLGTVRAEFGSYIRDVSEEIRPATGQFAHFDIRF